jgi:hypothetical protein
MNARQRIPGYPFLVQRLQHKTKPVDPKAAESIAKYFDFDYMGAAEFESGVIPLAKAALRRQMEAEGWIQPVKIKEGQHTAWYVGWFQGGGIEMARMWFREELLSDVTGMLEPSRLRDAYLDVTPWSMDGWFCLDGGNRLGGHTWAVFKTKDHAREFLRGLRG